VIGFSHRGISVETKEPRITYQSLTSFYPAKKVVGNDFLQCQSVHPARESAVLFSAHRGKPGTQ
jgi:hypothetical protein